MRKGNYFEVIPDPNGAYVLIELTQGQWAQVEVEDWIGKGDNFKWCASKHKKTYYMVSRKNGIKISFHRLILGLEKGDSGPDHLDRNGLNNIKSNLRLDPEFRNNQNKGIKITNTSGFIGVRKVTKHKGKNHYWNVSVYFKSKRVVDKCFSFTNEGFLEAIKYRDEQVIKYHGEFAVRNLPMIF